MLSDNHHCSPIKHCKDAIDNFYLLKKKRKEKDVAFYKAMSHNSPSTYGVWFICTAY